MSGWATVAADAFVVWSPALAHELRAGLAMRAESYRRQGVALPSWLPEVSAALAALADGTALAPAVPNHSEPVPKCSAAKPCLGTVSAPRAGELLGVCDREVRRLIDTGKLAGHQGPNRRWHVEEESVMARVGAG